MTQQEAKKEQRRLNRYLPVKVVLERIHEQIPDVWDATKIVGKWVWIETDTKPERTVREMLSDLGFHWNTKREAWQHPCGEFRKFCPKGDPRDHYASIDAKELV